MVLTLSNKEGISLLGIIGIGLTTVIGSGIWKDSLLWSNSAGIFSLVALSVGWILMLTAGLSYAECVSMFPQGGGPYSYVGGVFGKKAGSFMGMLYLIAYWCVGAVLSFISALFTLAAISAPPAGGFELLITPNIVILTAAYVVVFAILSGVTPGKRFGNLAFIWSLIKIVLVLGVTLFVLMNWSPTTSFDIPTFEGFQGAVNASIWALLGFEVMLVFAGDTIDAEKTMPKGILIALPVFLVLYLVVSLGAAGIVGMGDIPDGTGSVGLIMTLAGSSGLSANLVFAFAAFSAIGTGYAMMAVTIKQTQVLAKDNVIPRNFASGQAVIILNALFMGVIAIIMTGVLDLVPLSVDIVAGVGVGLVVLSALLPAGVSAFVLRQRMPALVRPFKTPLHFVVFPLAILLSIYLLALNFWNAAFGLQALVLYAIVIFLVVIFAQLRRTTPAE